MSNATPSTKNPYGFFSSLAKSIYSPAFYANLPQKSFWSSVWFLVRVTFLLFLVGGIALSIPLIKNWDNIDQTVQNALNVYPDELVLTFQDGQVTSNQPEPYLIESQEVVPERWRDEFIESSGDDFPQNIVVIDTVTTFSPEQFAAYDTIVWLGKDTVYTENGNGSIEANPLSDVPNAVVDKAFVDGKVAQFWSTLKTMLPFFLLGAIVASILLVLLFRMVYLVILAVGVLIVGSVLKLGLDFEASYKVGLHAITLPSFLALALLGLGYSGFPFWFSLVSLLLVTVNLQKAKTLKLLK